MKVHVKKWNTLFLLLAFFGMASGTSGQGFAKGAYSYTAAYSVLNAGTAPIVSSTYVGNQATAASTPNAYVIKQETGIKVGQSVPSLGYRGPLDKKWNISLGIPMQVFLDHGYLQGNMVSAYEENPNLYWNGSPEFKYAVDFLYGADFVPVSSWAPVRCTVTFRFIPPVLGDNYNLNYDYRLNPSAAPDRGNLIFWIR